MSDTPPNTYRVGLPGQGEFETTDPRAAAVHLLAGMEPNDRGWVQLYGLKAVYQQTPKRDHDSPESRDAAARQ